MSDGELVRSCRAGDQDAWNELVERYSRYVYAIAAYGYRLSLQDAEDVFQEVFLRAYDRIGTLRKDEALRPWIAQLTRRMCLDRVAAAARGAPSAELESIDASASLAEIEEALDVHEALAGLGPPCAEILDRFFVRDESYRTIADALALPAGTVASRISRCLAKLRDRLEGRNEPPRASGRSMKR
jgi:RNA polymerase sigma-70 factor, ECF subfamily